MSRRNDRLFSSFDLLPESYRYRERVSQTRRIWVAVNSALVMMLVSFVICTFYRLRQRHEDDVRLAVTAMPLRELRSQVQRQQVRNKQRTLWCQQVESAKPNDDLLQTLAEIGSAVPGESSPILIDSIALQLPTEVPSASSVFGSNAEPIMRIQVRITEQFDLQGWLARLNESKRIDAAKLVSTSRAAVPTSGSTDQAYGDITARPVAGGVLP